MSHVTGQLKWTRAVFRKARRESEQLVLELSDGSERFMNYKNWDGTVQITANKLFSLVAGAPIKFATWEDYSVDKWFCDVEELENELPPFVSSLSTRWTVQHAHSGRRFDKKFIRTIECKASYPYALVRSTPQVIKSRLEVVVSLYPRDPLFEGFWGSVSYFYGTYRIDEDGSSHTLSYTVNTSHRELQHLSEDQVVDFVAAEEAKIVEAEKRVSKQSSS